MNKRMRPLMKIKSKMKTKRETPTTESELDMNRGLLGGFGNEFKPEMNGDSRFDNEGFSDEEFPDESDVNDDYMSICDEHF